MLDVLEVLDIGTYLYLKRYPSLDAFEIKVFNILTILGFGLLSVNLFNIPFFPINYIVNLLLFVLLSILLFL